MIFPRFIGMVHLPALPGSPVSTLSIVECIERALADARALEAGGADGLIIENFNDVPFRAHSVEPHTIAIMTRIGRAIREACSLPVGVNVLRNDAAAALGIALAIDAAFIRVNVHTGTMLTDQGLITGQADTTLRLRRTLGAEHIAILADVLVKHAVPLSPVPLEDAVDDLVHRGLADAVIVSGTGTGKPTSTEQVMQVADRCRDVPVYIGSGVTPESVGSVIPPAHGIIAGSWLKCEGDVARAVDQRRVEQLREAINANSQ